MTVYVFRVWLLPNPPLEFEPDTEVWRDIEIGGAHTLSDLHEAIFDAFDRHDTHAYEFITRDANGVALRSSVHPQLYDGGSSWQAMDDEEIDRFIEQVVPVDAPAEAKELIRELQSDPPAEANAAETTIADLDPEGLGSLTYTFDMGDGWHHQIELQETSEGDLEGDPHVVGEQGGAPPQYPDRDDR